VLPPPDNFRSQPPGSPFITVIAEHSLELSQVRLVEQIGRGLSALAHSHPERGTGTEGKTAAGLVQLPGRHSEVEQNEIWFELSDCA